MNLALPAQMVERTPTLRVSHRSGSELRAAQDRI